jgi:hypothetical protein
MRSIAILIILIYHLPGYSLNFYDLNTIGIGIDFSIFRELSKYFGLALFVFISGHLSNLKERDFTDTHAVKNYMSRKIIKIFPLYYFALILFSYLYDIKEPLRVTTHILGLQLIFASQLVKPTLTLWFIGLILIYYAIYIFINAERISDFTKILVLALFPLTVVAVNEMFGVMDLRIVLYYGIFLLGLYSGKHDIFKEISWAQLVIVALGFTVFIVMRDNYTFATDPFSSLSSFLIINVLMVLFISFTYKSSLFFSDRIKIKRLVEIVSYSSFCMFLFHRPVWLWMHDTLGKMQIVESKVMMAIILAIIGIPAIVTLSYSIQHLYDRIVSVR